MVSLERNPALHPFCEALRDRLIVYLKSGTLPTNRNWWP